MGCMGRRDDRWQDRSARFQEKMDRMQYKMERFRSRMEGRNSYGPSSGNRAFDEYREETLKRLEEEQSEFKGFLDRLRHAKDKAEFDQFMNERRNRRHRRLRRPITSLRRADCPRQLAAHVPEKWIPVFRTGHAQLKSRPSASQAGGFFAA